MSKFKDGDEVVIRGRVVKGDGIGGAYLIRTNDECETWMFARACEAAKMVSPHTPTPPPNTVPVRIAVLVDCNGQAEVWVDISEATGGIMRALTQKDFEDGFPRISYITAHVPLPEQPADVVGVVEGGGAC